MRIFKYIVLIFIALALWTAFVGYGISNGFLLRSIADSEDLNSFMEASEKSMDVKTVKSRAMAIIENGEIVEESYYSVDAPIDRQTSFPAASISKWLTSWGVMKLVQEGKLDLDTPVDDYLNRWNLPESDYDNTSVTIRRLLSHSSGVTRDMEREIPKTREETPTVEAMLTDPSNLDEDEDVVNFEPGAQYAYSNVGYAILQLVIEETTQQSFPDYMQQTVFEPLQMTNSTFLLESRPGLELVSLYDRDGNTTQPTNFTGLAAAGLYTSVEDLLKLMQATTGKNPVLNTSTLDKMNTPVTFINDIPVYGLGPHLYSQGDTQSKIIGHDGVGGLVAINTAARYDLKSQDGIIVLQIGDDATASAIADEWLFWKAGIADFVVIQRNKNYLITLFSVGFLVIGIAAFLWIRKQNKSRRSSFN